MNKLLAGMQQVPTARTANGDVAHATTWNRALDLFGAIGSLRKDQPKALAMFKSAFKENVDLAVRIALWARDVRGGAGERESFRTILKALATGTDAEREVAAQLVPMVPELGRWDDLLCLLETPVKDVAIQTIAQGLHSGNGLCAKWMPRKRKEAAILREAFGMTPKQYRKLLVSMTNVVETAMCAKNWSNIDFGKLPALASARYQKAFTRHAPAEYSKYITALEKGEAKVNAGAIFPHDVLMSAISGRTEVASAQWKALPDFFKDSEEKVLAMVDVSESMTCPINNGKDGGNVTCMHVSVALGLYCGERNNGPFKDHFVTFDDRPKLVKSEPTRDLRTRWNDAIRHRGYSTNFDAAFQMILDTAVRHRVPQEDMPTMLLVLSDMQFNPRWGYSQTANERLKKAYQAAGYTMPKMVYWNLNATYGNTPITMHDKNCALVSGFSPSILSAVLRAREFDPCAVMLETVMSDRYKWQMPE